MQPLERFELTPRGLAATSTPSSTTGDTCAHGCPLDNRDSEAPTCARCACSEPGLYLGKRSGMSDRWRVARVGGDLVQPTLDGLKAWGSPKHEGGKCIQDALPHLGPAMREWIKDGTTPEEWQEYLGVDLDKLPDRGPLEFVLVDEPARDACVELADGVAFGGLYYWQSGGRRACTRS